MTKIYHEHLIHKAFSAHWNLDFLNNIFLFEMGCRMVACRLQTFYFAEVAYMNWMEQKEKNLWKQALERERLKLGQKWNVDGNFMLLDGGLSYVHSSEERTVIDLDVQIHFYLRYLRLPICNKIDNLLFSGFECIWNW